MNVILSIQEKVNLNVITTGAPARGRVAKYSIR